MRNSITIMLLLVALVSNAQITLYSDLDAATIKPCIIDDMAAFYYEDHQNNNIRVFKRDNSTVDISITVPVGYSWISNIAPSSAYTTTGVLATTVIFKNDSNKYKACVIDENGDIIFEKDDIISATLVIDMLALYSTTKTYIYNLPKNTSSLKNESSSLFEAYPNPVVSQLQICTTANLIMYVYTEGGTLVEIIDSTIQYVDMSNYTPGVYIIKSGETSISVIKK